MENEDRIDAAFRAIVSRDMVGDITASGLKRLNEEKASIIASMERYLGFLDTLMPNDAEWSRARGYLLYLAGQMKSLNEAEVATLQEFFKSSNEAAMDSMTT